MSVIIPQDLAIESSTQKVPLGTRHESFNGKVYRYCKANEALDAGAILTMVNIADGDADASVGAVLNDAAVTFTAETVGALVKINAGTKGIDDVPNRVLSQTDNQLVLETAWSADLTTSEDYVVYKPFLVEECDAADERIYGVTNIDVTSGNFFWMQIQGHVDAVLVAGDTDAIVQYEGIVSSAAAGVAKGLTAAATTVDEAEKANIIALVPTALAAQSIPAILNCMG